MRVITLVMPICVAWFIVLAAGCTGTSGTAPASTVPSASAATSWSGAWDTRGSTPAAYQTIGVLTLSQTGSSVTGTFSNNDHGNGILTGTVTGNMLSGTWSMDYGYETDSGSFKFVLSEDSNSFAGTWVAANDKANTLSTTSDFWDGTRR